MVAPEVVMLEARTAEIRGGVTSLLLTVTVTVAEVVVLPAASRATAVRVWEPLAAAVVVHETPKGAEVFSAPRLAPSRRNCTPATPTLSEALAATVTGPVTVAPEAGALNDTVGGVVSAVLPIRTWEGILTTKAS